MIKKVMNLEQIKQYLIRRDYLMSKGYITYGKVRSS